jgi:hypothetical protein
VKQKLNNSYLTNAITSEWAMFVTWKPLTPLDTTARQQYCGYIVAVSVIRGGNRTTWRKPLT